VHRRTHTDIEVLSENQVDDLWTDDGERELSFPWRGKTVFDILHLPAPPGYEYQSGRLTKVQKTARPENVWVEVWRGMGPAQQAKAKEEWKKLKPLRDAARHRRGIFGIPEDEKEAYQKAMAEARAKLAPPKFPAMPLLAHIAAAPAKSSKSRKDQNSRKHEEHIAPKGFMSEEWFSCVHTPVPIKEARKLQEGRDGLNKEWTKLENKPSWDPSKVKPKQQVMAEAKANNRKVHFGSLMELCHIKNSQLGKEFWVYKGRIVFRGDLVKDETGQFAVFTEQGASASHMAAAKFMDAISRMPGNSGEDSDAVGAYTQAPRLPLLRHLSF
jgi:hypothetical protein